MPTPEQHAVLSASSSARWLNCTASARLAEKCPRQDTAYTTAGTLAHKLAELKARKYFCGPMSLKDYRAELAVIQKDPAYDKGMDSATDLYLDHLKELTMAYDGRPFVALESRVDYSDWAPEGFGTADCLIISADKLCVVDYKNGAGVDVSAEDNSQMKLYALGALKLYAPIYGDSIQTISLSIVQPHAGGVKRWETTREDLMFWGKHTVWPRAQLAFHGEGTPKPGEWCEKTFCPMRHQCRAYGDWAAKLAFLPQTPPEQLSPEDLGERFALVKRIEAYAKSLKDYVEKQLLAGASIPGCKLVAGRSSRAWLNGTDAAFDQLRARGISDAMLYTKEPVTVAGLEKLLGAKLFKEQAEDLVMKLPGKPAAVLESDKRPAYTAAAAAFAES